MKFLFSLLTLFLVNKDCESKKAAITDSEEITASIAEVSSSKQVQDENMTVSYTAQTRGTYQHVSISKSEISISNSRNESETKTYACSDNDWKDITDLMSKINVESLGKLVAPSSDSHRDAALAATFTLEKDGQKMSTPTFDHGNPPKEIEALVNKLLSVKENAEKQ